MEDKKKKDWLFRFFLTISVIWTIVVFWLLFDDQYYYNGSSAMELNEVGDFLTGSFSPLAFFWLAYGYWMQNIVISESKTEKEELKRTELIAIQPILEFSVCELGLSVKNGEWEKNGILSFRIENHGHTATKFHLTIKGCFEGRTYSEVLKEGKNNFDLLLTLTGIGLKPSFSIDIDYLDAMKEIRKLKYNATIKFHDEREDPFECDLELHPTLNRDNTGSWSFYDVGTYLSEMKWP